jgi:hypothetical protein
MATSARNTAPVEIRLALKGSKTLIPAVLFALAFAGSLVVVERPDSPAPVSSPVPRHRAPEIPHEADAPRTDRAAAPVPRDPPVPETMVVSDGPPEVLPAADAPPRTADDVSQSTDTLRESLRLAAADEDPDVAARAQEAYDSLLQREDP